MLRELDTVHSNITHVTKDVINNEKVIVKHLYI